MNFKLFVKLLLLLRCDRDFHEAEAAAGADAPPRSPAAQRRAEALSQIHLNQLEEAALLRGELPLSVKMCEGLLDWKHRTAISCVGALG